MADFQEVSYNSPIEGEISENAGNAHEEDGEELTTLDEPVKDTVLRDLKAVAQKFSHIVYPRKNSVLLRDWDLWGPLILCVIMAFLLQGVKDEKTGGGGPQFAQVFVVVWVGAGIVTLNSQLLGGHISFFQSVCVLGYCMFPLVVAMVFCWTVVKLISHQTAILVVLRLIFTSVGYGWSIFASLTFLGDSQPVGRKALAVYPICLFYFILAWMVATYS
ncbi:protein YIPF6-like [Clavelina lepadiformis]|uniref:Protein YIPF n=1 Tax=Clavelina lepadiformis TaxID=159417 RepID=A0ABP0FVI7_CLALP